MQLIESRNFIRHPVYLPLSYNIVEKSLKKNSKSIRAKTTNVSLGGLLFPSKRPVGPKSRIVIKMPFENKVFNVKAQVVRCIQNSETKLYDIAVNFSKAQEAFKAKMIEQIYQIAGYREMLRVQSGKDISMEEASRRWVDLYSARFKSLYW